MDCWKEKRFLFPFFSNILLYYPCDFRKNVVTLQPERCSVHLWLNSIIRKYNITIKNKTNAYYSTIGKKGQKRSS